MKKIWRTILSAAIIWLAVSTPVYAQQEKETAGSSLKQQISEDLPVNAKGTPGWQMEGDRWKYLDSDGTYPSTAWRKIDGQWYYFNSQGYWVENNKYEKGTLKGIDVSYYQGNINWSAVRADGIQFAFIRIGRSPRVLDSKYKEYIRQANAVGIPVGVYYYSKARSESEAVLDAQFVIKNMKGYKISYPVVIDVEDPSIQNLGKAKVASIAKAFCDEIRAAGYTPMIYANENWCRNYIDMSQLGNVEKWIARYNYLWSEDLPRGVWQCTSKGRVSGISGNVDIDFGYKDYTKIVTPRTAPIASYVPREGEWYSNGIGKWYEYYAGGYPKNTWKQIDGAWYWFNARGYAATGWLYESGDWYWLDSAGRMTTGWHYIDSKWYYMNASGRMQKNCWIGDYWLKESGAMAVDEWVDGGKYYVDASGKKVPGKVPSYEGWQEDAYGKWYRNPDGSYPKNTWKKIDNEWYWFEASGYLKTGWIYTGGKWYYSDSQGRRLSGCWVGGYYLKEDGTMATNEWVDGGKYYVDASGLKVSGASQSSGAWKKDGYGWWYRNADGSYPKNEWKFISGKWYWFEPNGYMKTGWFQQGNIWYYLKSDGAMATGTIKIGNRTYSFNGSGVWLGY